MQIDDEKQIRRLAPADPAVLRLLQLTDCHILAGADDGLRGMNTRASFEAVYTDAIGKNADFDMILATGDLSQDGSEASYHYLARHFDALRLPLFWLPGNHDDPGQMRQHLRGEWISPARQVLAGNWLIVMLDSTIAGETAGDINDDQLEFLRSCLRAHGDRHALVCLHHQPLPTGSEWIDQLGVRQRQRFVDTIKTHSNVRAVLWGHVHQQVHRRIDGIEWMATPSTCVQFKPRSKAFALDDLAPGYRRIELHADGRVSSEVRRIARREFAVG